MIGEEKLKLSLMGRFIANKQINSEAFRNTIAKIWRTNQEVQIVDMNNNTYAFYFSSLTDRSRVLAGDPWHFDNYVLVLEESSKYRELREMKFNIVEFWIQIHNVPLICMTKETSLFLGERIGKVTSIDKGEEDSGRDGRFIRVRVEVDVQKPLKRLLKVDLTGKGESMMLVLRYERLADFCFGCGLLGHGERECPTNHTSYISGSKPYGPWMRATSPPKRQGNWSKKEGVNNRESEMMRWRENLGEVRSVTTSTEGAKQPIMEGPPVRQETGRKVDQRVDSWKGKKAEVQTSLQEEVQPVVNVPKQKGACLSNKAQRGVSQSEERRMLVKLDEMSKFVLEKERGASLLTPTEEIEGIITENNKIPPIKPTLTTQNNRSGLSNVHSKLKVGPNEIENQQKAQQPILKISEGQGAGHVECKKVEGQQMKSWKRLARKGPVSMEDEPENHVCGKRALEVGSGEGPVLLKKSKQVVKQELKAVVLSASRDESPACRSQ